MKANSTSSASTEALSYSSGRGYYLIKVSSYSGSGDYDACVNIP